MENPRKHTLPRPQLTLLLVHWIVSLTHLHPRTPRDLSCATIKVPHLLPAWTLLYFHLKDLTLYLSAKTWRTNGLYSP